MSIWVWVVLAWYVAWSVATLGVFAWDKRAAERGDWRVRERTLHLLELAGGWPGALAGMRLVRHKGRKWSYFLVTWAIGAVHLGVWVWVLRERAGW